MVAFLSKPTKSDGFEQIVDFLNAHPIRYALTINPTIYISCIEQFWSTAMAKTINGEAQLHALVDGKEIIITESSVRRDLRLADEEGVDCLPNSTIFEQLTLMGSKTTAWNKFSSTVVSASLTIPIDPHHTPTIIQPSTQPQKKQQPRNPKRKDTQVPQPSDPIDNVPDEAVHEELSNSLVRAATTASSLEAEQDSGGCPWCQETMEDTTAQTRFESVSKYSNDLLVARGNTLRSDEDSLKLDESTALCTTLQNRVLVLEKTTTTQHNEMASLKRRVKKLEKKNMSRTHSLKRLYKVGLTARVESSGNKESLGEDASKQGRIDAIDAYEEITLDSVHDEVNDKGKGIMIEHVKPMKRKDQIRLDEEAALKLQAAFDEEERLAKEKAEKKMFDRAFKRVNTFEDFRTELLEGKEKRAGTELIQEITKKQKVEDDKETSKLKQLMEIILDEEEVTIDAIPLSVKEDLKDLYKLVKAKYESTRPVKDLDLLLWDDLKSMFKPHVEDEVWKMQQGYKVLNLKLYDSCGVHSLMIQSMQIYILVEKKYSLTPPTFSMMLKKKFIVEYESEMAYQLLRFIMKHLKK
nr:hypothetical protein [Tanacetum cinerariifolium]